MPNPQDIAQEPAATAVSRLVAIARQKGEPDAFEGKRQWVRYTIGLRLEATRDPNKSWASWSVVTHNVSGGGIGFWSKHKLTLGTSVHVREWTDNNSGEWLPAKVTHCAVGIRGYLIGAAYLNPRPPDGDVHPDADAIARSGASGQANSEGGAARRSLAQRISLGTKCAYAAAAAGAAGVLAMDGICSLFRPNTEELWVTLVGSILAFVIAGLLGGLIVRGEVRFLEAFSRNVRGIATGEKVPLTQVDAPCRELADVHRASLELEALWRRHEDDGRIQRQRLEEINQVKSNILSIVSHDLRTPLTSILLYAQMLTDELATLEKEDQRRFLGIISEECTRLSRLVDDLLDLQRLEAGRAKWDVKPQDLSKVITTCARVFEAMALSKSMTLVVDCPPSLPPVEADSDKISQVLSNLLSNAIKYTPACGTVQLSVEADNNNILIRVADSGPGIPRDQWEHIFDRFSQLANPDVREIAGAGLGLYIVRQIIKRHGGAVWVNSEVGKGAEFFVSLPIQVATVRTESVADGLPSAGRVIVCDADPELAAMIGQTLRAQDFNVRVVHSGCQLLALLQQGDVDVVVTDVLLPDIDAPELLDALKTSRSRTLKLVVHSYASDGAELRRRGADIFLQRPASRQDLVQAVQVAMRKQSTSGMTVLIVESEGIEARRLSGLLTERGHMAVMADSIPAAAVQVRQYPVDLIVLSDRSLLGDWTRLEGLNINKENNIHVVVLCDTVRRKGQQLADAYGVGLLRYQAGQEEHVADTITTFRETPVKEVVA